MYHPEYLALCAEITELICIFNMVRSAVFVINFPGYSIKFTPTVSCNQIGSNFCGRNSTTMREYVTVRPTGIFLRAKKRILFINFSTFPGNLSESRPHSFENQFHQRYLVYFYFA